MVPWNPVPGPGVAADLVERSARAGARPHRDPSGSAMKVYVLVLGEYDDAEPAGVFTTLAAAQARGGGTWTQLPTGYMGAWGNKLTDDPSALIYIFDLDDADTVG